MTTTIRFIFANIAILTLMSSCSNAAPLIIKRTAPSTDCTEGTALQKLKCRLSVLQNNIVSLVNQHAPHPTCTHAVEKRYLWRGGNHMTVRQHMYSCNGHVDHKFISLCRANCIQTTVLVTSAWLSKQPVNCSINWKD